MNLNYSNLYILIFVMLVDAAKKSNICKGKPRTSYFQHPLGCKHYISCAKGVPSTGVCDEGMLFSLKKPPCVEADESECEDTTRSTTQSTKETTTTIKTTTEKKTTTTTVASTTTTTTTEATTTYPFFLWPLTPEITTIIPPTPKLPDPVPPTPPLEPSTTTLKTTLPAVSKRSPSTPASLSVSTRKKRRKTTTRKTPTTVAVDGGNEDELISTTTKVPVTTTNNTTTPTATTITTTSITTIATITEESTSNTTGTETITNSMMFNNTLTDESLQNGNETTTEGSITVTESNSLFERGISCPYEDNIGNITFRSSNVNCSRYYICYHGSPMVMNCPEDLHWNNATDKCEPPEIAKCTININTAISTFPVCPIDSVKFFPHPERCERFLYCNKGHMTVQQCPYFYHWDYEKEKCLEQNIAKCSISPENQIKYSKQRGKGRYRT